MTAVPFDLAGSGRKTVRVGTDTLKSHGPYFSAPGRLGRKRSDGRSSSGNDHCSEPGAAPGYKRIVVCADNAEAAGRSDATTIVVRCLCDAREAMKLLPRAWTDLYAGKL